MNKFSAFAGSMYGTSMRSRTSDRSREAPYTPPESSAVNEMTLGELLDGFRSVVPAQQVRFGFDAAGLGMHVWCVGDVSNVRSKAVAVVGTRDVSENGRLRARKIARELSQAGIVLVSGLAKGVDTEALTAAIDNGGRVSAVIGTPVNKAYPPENKRLQEQIYRDHLLVSQFAPGQKTYQSHFPERNKLMAALSDATVIIEAGETSGTLHQAAECVRLGRWLFVAQNVLEDRSLTWPRRFEVYERFRPLKVTEDILTVLQA
jgi:DNA processing protein